MKVKRIGYCVKVNEHEMQLNSGVIPEDIKFAIYIDGNRQAWGVEDEFAAEILASYGENSKSEMIGKSDYIIIYDDTKEFKINNHRFIDGDCLVMKSHYGLKCMSEAEIEEAQQEFKKNTGRYQIGPYCFQAYKLAD